MTTTTFLFLLLSVIIAAGLSFYQYLYKVKNQSKLYWFLAFLRFVSLFSIFLLLINPIVSRKITEIKKAPLPIVVDNSKSISELKATKEASELYQKIIENKAITEKYDVQLFSFDDEFNSLEQLDFKGNQSHIDGVAKNLKQLYRNTNYPVVLFTDGNQTMGNDYVFSFQENTSILPVVLGDTTTVFDLKINQINVNKYAFLKNKFPVEVFLQYNGNQTISTTFAIQNGNQTIHKQTVSFSKDKRAQSISVLLNADKVGIAKYKAVISSNIKEKNTVNNTKNFAVEVIDQRSEIALISAINHPDLGVLKRSIETNQQRKVSILKPDEVKSLQNYNILVLYQPTASFKAIFEQNKAAQINTFVITGTATDFNFLNQVQSDLLFKMSAQKEDYLATYESNFNLFSQANIGFENFPPLEHNFGTISIKSNVNSLLSARIRNVQLPNPLLTFTENGSKRNAYLLGENIWKWRLENNLNKKSFEDFDLFTDKIIQFLVTNASKKNLNVTYESFYNSGENIEITTEYFNKNYEFDDKAQLTIQVVNSKTKATKKYDLLKATNSYKVNLDGLEAGNYSFKVTEKQSNSSFSGSFEVLDFEIEKQFVNPDRNRLEQLATNTNGKVYYPNQIENLIKSLVENDNYIPVQKATIKKSPLIDWIWLLILAIIALATEWFVRKYNGLL
jgi:predicted double-glycine peptidase